jgi:NADPH:quinone reductase-like Zn-dependent oxidoreductase
VHGGIDQLRYEATGDPHLTADQDVMVKLRAASVNSNDISIGNGVPGVKIDFPHIIGSDGAGTIVAAGTGVRSVKLGDSVTLYPASRCDVCEFV